MVNDAERTGARCSISLFHAPTRSGGRRGGEVNPSPSAERKNAGGLTCLLSHDPLVPILPRWTIVFCDPSGCPTVLPTHHYPFLVLIYIGLSMSMALANKNVNLVTIARQLCL